MGEVTEKRVFLDIAVDSKPVGRIEIKLFTEQAPKTCENFRALCTGEVGMAPNNKARLHYKGNQFHRVVKKFMIQGGDITEGDGRGGFSVYGRYFEDEKFILKHTKPYLLSMANKGSNSNSSQFFITTAPAPHCNDKHVVFGEVIRGQHVVDFVENLEVDDKAKPKATVEISNCGELIKKQKKPAEVEDPNAQKQDENSGIPEAPKSWLYRDDKDDRGEKRSTYARRDDRRDDRKHYDRKEDRRDDRRRDDRRRSRTRSRSRDRRRRDHSRDRDRHRDRDNERGDRRERRNDEIRVRGRGGVRYRRERSLTPEHWRENKPKKFVQKNDRDSERLEPYFDRSRLI